LSITAREIVRGALLELGVLASGEAVTAEDQTDCLTKLNQMLGSWSTEELLIYGNVREVFPLTGGKASYTMGASVSADFNTPRPMDIQNIRVQITGSNPSNEVPVDMLTDEEWADVLVKGTPGSFPTKAHQQNSYPLEIIDFWPIPSAGNNIVIYSSKALSFIANANTVIDLPPGYDHAIQMNLAVVLGPRYGKAITPDLMTQAVDSKANIKRQNIKPVYLKCDTAILNRTGTFNWMTGE
jgi:hypothetical protein